MAGIKVQKNYRVVNSANATVSNNWYVLVYGVTSRGTNIPTLVKSYTEFTSLFGQPVKGVLTHAYMRFLLESGVNVLFKRIIDSKKLIAANTTIKNKSDVDLFSIKAKDAYLGNIGNEISVKIEKNDTTDICTFNVKLNEETVEVFSLGQAINNDVGSLVYTFVKYASKNINGVSDYIDFAIISDNESDYNETFPMDSFVTLSGGSEPTNDLNSALVLLGDSTSELYTDVRLLHSMLYYPQLRFVTTGGLCHSDITKQNIILENLGKFATKCDSTFRVLVDYSTEMTDINTVRNFAKSIAAKNEISPAIFAFFGFWGADNNNNYLPGSAGFLTALGLSGYNVYSRRIAGSSFTPGFTQPYKELYIDLLDDWQGESTIQANPIMIVDANNNLAVMGSSTLAMPQSTPTRKNPAQSLDVVCVADYVSCLIYRDTFSMLEASLDRLNLNALISTLNTSISDFVSSGAITRYDLNLDISQLGKLGVNCTLYFMINLEEVSITVTSTYDLNTVQI